MLPWIPTLLLLGCMGGGPPPAETPAPQTAQPEAEAEVEADEVVEASGQEDEAVRHEIRRGDPRAYASRWLVVVQRSTQLDLPFPGIERLRQVEGVGVDPAWVYSSHLNVMKPCEDVVVAAAYNKREEAQYFGHRISQSGFTTEVLQAGAYVPLDGRLEQWCEASRQQVPASCGGSMHFLEQHGGTHWLDLDVSNDVLLRAMAHAGSFEMAKEDPAWWSAGVANVKELGEYTIGDQWSAYGETGEATACRLVGFAIITRGTPHHRLVEGATEPTCGGPRLFAEMSCGNVEASWAIAADDEPPVRFLPVDDAPLPSAMASAMLTLTKSPLYVQLRETARGEAEKEHMLLKEATQIDRYREVVRDAGTDGAKVDVPREFLLVRSTLSSGDGDLSCGSADVHIEIVGLIDEKGEVVSAFREMSGDVMSIVDIDGDGRAEILQRPWPGAPTLYDAEGTAICRLPTAYCDSPCEARL